MKIPADKRRETTEQDRAAIKFAFILLVIVLVLAGFAKAANAAGPQLDPEKPTAWVLAEICRTEECVENRRAEVAEGAATIIDACTQAAIPPSWCAAVIYGAIGESNFQAHPSCGLGVEHAIYCDGEIDPASRARCYVDLARDAGRSEVRAARCNDRGKARGPWQMRSTIRSICGASPHEWEAAACFIQQLKRAAASAKTVCGARNPEAALAIAMKRVGAGPTMRGGFPQCGVSAYAVQSRRRIRHLASQPASEPPRTEPLPQ